MKELTPMTETKIQGTMIKEGFYILLFPKSVLLHSIFLLKLSVSGESRVPQSTPKEDIIPSGHVTTGRHTAPLQACSVQDSTAENIVVLKAIIPSTNWQDTRTNPARKIVNYVFMK
jgi:hypothetical protein